MMWYNNNAICYHVFIVLTLVVEVSSSFVHVSKKNLLMRVNR